MDEKIAIYHALIIKGYEKWINHFEMLYGWMKILSEVMEIILCVFDGEISSGNSDGLHPSSKMPIFAVKGTRTPILCSRDH